MRLLRLVAFLAAPMQIAVSQQTSSPIRNGTLTLEDAIAIAQRNNPLYLQVQNETRSADANVRAAYGSLLPTASASFNTQYTQGGTQYVQGVALGGASGDTYNGSYRLGLNYNVNAGAAFVPRAAKAQRTAADADIVNQTEVLRSAVTQDYINALEAEAQAVTQDTLVESAKGQLDLVNAKLKVGAGTIIDVRGAEVQVGQAEVAALTSHNNARVAKARLFQDMGIPAELDVRLTTTFPVTQPPFSLDSVLDLARRVNPDVAARKSRLYADEMQVKVQKAQYLPSLSLSTGYGANSFGYANPDFLVAQSQLSAAQSAASCLSLDSLRAGAGLQPKPCGTGTLTPDQIASIRSGNQPFKFNKAPYSVFLGFSVPVFNGFQREANIEQAKVTRDNAQYDLRARNLQLTTDVTQAYLNLATAARTVELQTQIAGKAAEDLALNEASFRVGAKTFLDVTTARGLYQQAVMNRVTSIYDYHKAFAALESAVGRPLR